MAQLLSFEPAWERTISEQDRKIILERFHHIQEEEASDVFLTFLWCAHNHCNELLVTSLVHNWSSKPIWFTDQLVHCFFGDIEIAARKFCLLFEIPAHTSIPWTFIFPEKDVCRGVKLENIKLQLDGSDSSFHESVAHGSYDE